MSRELVKQRSVGLLALLVLGTIAWLLLFGLDQEPELDRRSQLPAAPELERVEPIAPRLPEPVLPETEFPPPPAEPDVQVAAAVEETEAGAEAARSAAAESEEPGLDEQGLPRAWMVQVASLSRVDRAEQLRDQLMEAGFKAWLQAGAGGTTRVLVGPRMQRSAAEQDKAAIEGQWKLETLLLRFEAPGNLE